MDLRPNGAGDAVAAITRKGKLGLAHGVLVIPKLELNDGEKVMNGQGRRQLERELQVGPRSGEVAKAPAEHATSDEDATVLFASLPVQDSRQLVEQVDDIEERESLVVLLDGRCEVGRPAFEALVLAFWIASKDGLAEL